MNILGISCYYHDAASALLINGQTVAAAEEERFSRIKHDSGFPEKSIDFCLETAGVKSSELDYVIFYEKPFKKFERIIMTDLACSPFAYNNFYHSTHTLFSEKLWIKETISKKLGVDPKKILFCEHHLSHAASSFYPSPFPSSAILTTDGVGEWTTQAWGKGKGNDIILTHEVRFPHSLGLFYSAFTQYLGFEVNEGEFKVMGLAPYGKPVHTNLVRRLIRQAPDGSFLLDLSYFSFHRSLTKSYSEKFVKLFGLPSNKNPDKVLKPYADIAASAQSVLEECLVKTAKYIKKETGEENLCLAGGVALNGVANWKIYKEAGFKNIFIQPASGDSGGALGAALYLHHGILKGKRKYTQFLPYLGKDITKEEIKSFLKKNKITYQYLPNKKLIKLIAGKLASGRVIGWVQGRFEWGPRALGARSILADPRPRKMKDVVNFKIKFREAFRPFAPVVTYEKAADYFNLEAGDRLQDPLQFMLFVLPVRKSKREKLQAITHVDGTARPQLIKKEVNPFYYELITEFEKLTGIPVLLNTSFNLKGEPIVNSCFDAYNTFCKSGLDILVLGNFVIYKS